MCVTNSVKICESIDKVGKAMSVIVDDATKRRLVYVKKLYLHGQEHISYQTEFDRLIAIHHFDNAVELLLKCIATQFDVTFDRPLHVSFYDLWERVNEKYQRNIGSELPKEAEMFQLHDLRCDVQHLGLSSFSSEVVTRSDVYVSDFVTQVMRDVFGIDFKELFISSLVKDTTLRKILATAEKAFEEEDYTKCVRYADAAFNEALSMQRERFGFSIFSVIEGTVEVLADIVLILALGIDYIEYAKYKKTSPPTYAKWNKEEERVSCVRLFVEVFAEQDTLLNKLYSRETAFFNLGFVLNCILRWHL